MTSNVTSPTPEVLPPPVERYSLLGWLKKNLFQNWFSTLATIFMLAVGFVVVRGMVQWVLFAADWRVIQTNLQLLLIGQYPRDQVWRLWLILLLMGAISGLSWGCGCATTAWGLRCSSWACRFCWRSCPTTPSPGCCG